MPSKQLHRLIVLIDWQGSKPIAVDGGMKDCFEIIVIRFTIGMQWSPVVLGGKGMDRSRIEASFAKGTLYRPMIDSRHLDGDDGVSDFVFLAGSLHPLRHRFKGECVMFNDGGFDNDLAIKVAEHPLGTLLRAIYRDNPEVLRSDVSYTLLNLSVWLANEAILGNLGRTLFRNCGHL